MDIGNSPDTSSSEQLPNKEQILADLAKWWGDRLICRFSEEPELQRMQQLLGTRRQYGNVALVSRHANNEEEREGIQALGGFIGVPNSEQNIFYGQSAASQILYSLGLGGHAHSPYGKPHDGLTHVYLQHVGDLGEGVASRYYSGEPTGFELAFAEKRPMSLQAARSAIEYIIQAPWETLEMTLTENPDLLRKWLKGRLLIDMSNPDFVYLLRILENKNLLAII